MIYFAQAQGTDLIKIGFTGGDPVKRVSELQTGCPHKLVLLASIEGSEQDEARWHRDFVADRVNGEWFKMSWRLMLAIARTETTQAIAKAIAPAAPTNGPDEHREGDPALAWWPQFIGMRYKHDLAISSTLRLATVQLVCPNHTEAELHLFFHACDRTRAIWLTDLGRPKGICHALQAFFKDSREYRLVISLLSSDKRSWDVLADTHHETR